MNSRSNTILTISLSAIMAAIYVAVCYVLQPISFGPIQFRFSEILCLFAIDYPWALIGVSVGCFLSNMFVGGLGVLDIVFGTLATIVGCLLAYIFRNKHYKDYPILSTLMIVLANAIIVGIELGIILETPNLIWLYMLQVGFGELVVLVIGLPIYKKVSVVLKNKLS